MKGFESMMPEKQPPKDEPRIAQQRSIGEEVELEELGEEIEKELAAEEEQKQSPEEQIRNFYTSKSWSKWQEVKDSAKSEIKEPVRQEVLTKLHELENQVAGNEKLEKAINLIKDELEKDAGHA